MSSLTSALSPRQEPTRTVRLPTIRTNLRDGQMADVVRFYASEKARYAPAKAPVVANAFCKLLFQGTKAK